MKSGQCGEEDSKSPKTDKSEAHMVQLMWAVFLLFKSIHFSRNTLIKKYLSMTVTNKCERGHSQMTSVERGREGVGQFLTRGREVA